MYVILHFVTFPNVTCGDCLETFVGSMHNDPFPGERLWKNWRWTEGAHPEGSSKYRTSTGAHPKTFGVFGEGEFTNHGSANSYMMGIASQNSVRSVIAEGHPGQI